MQDSSRSEAAAEVTEYITVCIKEGLEEPTFLRDTVFLVHAILNDQVCRFFDDEPFIELLADHFEDEHPIWRHVEIE